MSQDLVAAQRLSAEMQRLATALNDTLAQITGVRTTCFVLIVCNGDVAQHVTNCSPEDARGLAEAFAKDVGPDVPLHENSEIGGTNGLPKREG